MYIISHTGWGYKIGAAGKQTMGKGGLQNITNGFKIWLFQISVVAVTTSFSQVPYSCELKSSACADNLGSSSQKENITVNFVLHSSAYKSKVSYFLYHVFLSRCAVSFFVVATGNSQL